MWKEVWVLMLVLAFICLAIAILLTFVWDIINLIDELSGRKAKRQIKRLHELNSSTGTFDKLSTNEIYSGISSGTLLNEELHNTYEEEVDNFSSVENPDMDMEESPTSYLEEDGEESTSYLGEDSDLATSYLDLSDEGGTVVSKDLVGSKIFIIEEQSSL